jgi:hypothetical protein
MKKTNKSIKLLKAEIIEQLFKINNKNHLVNILDYIKKLNITPIKEIDTNNNEEIYLTYRGSEDWDTGGWCTWNGYKVNLDDYELIRDAKRDAYGKVLQGIFKLKK